MFFLPDIDSNNAVSFYEPDLYFTIKWLVGIHFLSNKDTNTAVPFYDPDLYFTVEWFGQFLHLL